MSNDKKAATELADQDLDQAAGGFTLNEELLAWWQSPQGIKGEQSGELDATRHYDPAEKQKIEGKSTAD